MRLYLAGSYYPEFEDLIKEEGLHRLFSWLIDKRALVKKFERGENVFVDSGAFSAHTQGTEIDLDAYIKFLNDNDNFIDVFAQVDKIPGKFREPKTKEQLLEAPEQSWANYLFMVQLVDAPEKLLPIYHQGENFKHLDRMLEHKVPYIGISPANDASQIQKEVWMEEVWRRILKSCHPEVKTHAFGMTKLAHLEMFPFYSADSTSWRLNSAFGGIMTRFGSLAVSKVQYGSPTHISSQPKAVQGELIEYIESKGFTLEQLSVEHVARSAFNIRFLGDWQRNYVYKPKKVTQRKLF